MESREVRKVGGYGVVKVDEGGCSALVGTETEEKEGDEDGDSEES